MKNWKSVIALMMAVCVCGALAACGGTDEETTADNTTTTTSATTAPADDEPETTEAVQEETEPAETEAEKVEEEPKVEEDEVDEELFAYYDLIDEEYQKVGYTGYIDLRNNNDTYYMHDDKIYTKGILGYKNKIIACIESNGVNKSVEKLYIYDIDTKETTIAADLGFGAEYNEVYFCNGVFAYFGGSVSKYHIKTMDIDGNVLGERELPVEGASIKCVTVDGDIIVNYDVEEPEETDFGTNYVMKRKLVRFNSDLSEETEIAPPETAANEDDEFLFEEGLFVDCLDVYQVSPNKIWFMNKENYDSGDFYVLNTTDLTWENKNFGSAFANHKYSEAYFNIKSARSVGKYLIGNQFVYDTEADEFVVNDLAYYRLGGGYFGGDSQLCINKNASTWYTVQCPSDGSEPTEETSIGSFSGLLDEKGAVATSIVPISDKYYVIAGDSGLYLYTYEGGKDSEEVIAEY